MKSMKKRIVCTLLLCFTFCIAASCGKRQEASEGGRHASRSEAAAETYFRESAALYAQAVREGYSVTEEEIEESVAALKKEFSDEALSEESRKEMTAIIGQFESEEDYWDYERQAYARILPVQKYVSDMEQKYFENHPKASDDEWIEYFEDHKKELVEKENFTKL